jgi:hypothetical protein
VAVVAEVAARMKLRSYNAALCFDQRAALANVLPALRGCNRQSEVDA